ncbi:PREDICTED: uncharacterized protein LOC107163812 [Diuraphis noxia]|uniref:uncharacterized protein LOC107163812 n=1 Tax=Diuraphis noxia TaxID=143948 RepID=UPI00076355EF|nr:PREDICTED: uncharacterized protein LOC107163812 [Diuraphis noxia]
MISKYMLLIGLISHDIVYSANMYFGMPSFPYYHPIPRNNVFQTLQDNVDSVHKKPEVQWNTQYQGSRLLQLPQVVNINNKDRKTDLRSYVNTQVVTRDNYLNNHQNWNIQALQDFFQSRQSKRQKQYQDYLLKKQEEIKRLQEQEKLKNETMLKKKVKQRSKFLQRLYFDNLLHREYDENELENHRNNADET